MLYEFWGIVINVSILFGLGSVFILLPLKISGSGWKPKILSGIAIGTITLIIMNAQYNITEGFVLDTRSIILSITAAFLGPVPAFIAASMASALRISQGGAGAFTGVVVIFATTFVGVIFNKYRVELLKPFTIRAVLELYVLGVVTHIVMLLCFFILPIDVALFVLGIITLPVMVIYPLVTVPIGLILLVQKRNVKNTLLIEEISNHDYLTGLKNRFYLEKFTASAPKGIEFGIIMGDVNGLKVINDTYGHLDGDSLLVLIANILEKSAPQGSIISRWGGDEFVILLEEANLIAINDVCITIKKECELVELHGINPSISLGYSVTEQGDFDKAFKEAEDLMYRNKLSEGASNRSSLISSLENTLIERKYESEHHSNNMINYALELGKSVNLMQNQLDNLSLVARLHDIGKIGISEEILLKPARLTKDEFEEIKKHSQIGARILDSIDELKHVSYYVLCHHEKYDGSGYPQRLIGEDIPLISRIISIVDAFEAMTSGRVYQDAKSVEEAKKELIRFKGTQFDPKLVDIFTKLI